MSLIHFYTYVFIHAFKMTDLARYSCPNKATIMLGSLVSAIMW